MMRRPLASGVLVCAECVKVSDERADGWRAYVAGGEDQEPVEVVVLCPGCVEREQLDRGC